MLVGQDQRYLGALIVLNPTELQTRGFITTEEAQQIMTASAATMVTGSRESEEGAQASLFLRDFAIRLDKNPALQTALASDLEVGCGKLYQCVMSCCMRVVIGS